METLLFNKYNITITKEDNSDYIYFSDEAYDYYETIDITDTDNINNFLEYLSNNYDYDISNEISQIIDTISSDNIQ